MVESPLFSIVIPIYNTEEYLNRCVLSALNQTYKNIEIILVDDGSTDSSPKICDRFENTDERIKVIHKKNGGLSDARNFGIINSVGKYILFLDSDDYLEHSACEKLSEAAETDCDIIVGKWIKSETPVQNHRCNVSVQQSNEYIKKSLKTGHLSMAAVLYIQKREFLSKNSLKFKYGIRHEDDEFTPRALLLAESIAETDIEFYHYIIREGSITTQKDLRRNAADLFDTCTELEKMYGEISDRELKNFLKDTLSMKMLSLFQDGKLYRYGKKYIYKKFIFRNAIRFRTKLKAILYCISPFLYWQINNIIRKTKNV